jgi:hypothetical protein
MIDFDAPIFFCDVKAIAQELIDLFLPSADAGDVIVFG